MDETHYKSKWLAFFMALLIFIGAIPVNAQNGTDFSSIVQVTDFSLKVNGSEVSAENPAVVGSDVDFSVAWKVDTGDFNNQYAAGDYFYIDLPTEHFSFTQTVMTNPLKYDGKIIACYGITADGRIYVELTQEGADQIHLSGTFLFGGKLEQTDEEGTITIKVGDVEKDVHIDKPDPGDTGEDFPNKWPDEGGEFEKYGIYDGPGSKGIKWYIRLNRDKYFGQAKGTDDTEQKDVLIEDELAEGQTLKLFGLQTYLFRPIDDTGKPSTVQASPMIPLFSKSYTTADFDRVGAVEVIQGSGQSYDDFRTQVMTQGGVAYGVYTSDTGIQTILIYLGDLPGNGITYEDMFEAQYGQGNFRDNLKACNSTLTEAELDVLVETWGTDNAIGGEITNYRIDIHTEGELGEKYANVAKLTYGEEEVESNRVEVQTRYLDGSINGGKPGSVCIYKEDSETGEPLTGAQFKLQQWVGGNWLDYTPLDGGPIVRETAGEDGLAEYGKLLPGHYRVVEVAAASGYDLNSVTYSPSDEFDITDTDTSGISIAAYNSKLSTRPPSGGVKLVKTDVADSDKRLSGAVFALFDSDGNKLGTYTTDGSGAIEVTDLPYGAYYFVETSAPEGYQLPEGEEAKTTFVVNENTLDGAYFLSLSVTNAKEKTPRTPGVPGTGDLPAYLLCTIGMGVAGATCVLLASRKRRGEK